MIPTLNESIKNEQRKKLIPIIISIINHHTDQKVQYQCVCYMFEIYENPTKAERLEITHSLCNCYHTEIQFNKELLPIIFDFTSSKKIGVLQLVSNTVAFASKSCSALIQLSFCLSILKQFAEFDSTHVRDVIVRNLANLVDSFIRNEDISFKVNDLLL
jgi:hypothetical protein